MTIQTGQECEVVREYHVKLDAAERAALDGLLGRSIRRLSNRTPLVDHGGKPGEIHVLIEGWAC